MGAVGSLHVHVRLGTVPRVPDLTDHLSGFDNVTDLDTDRIPVQVGDRHERPFSAKSHHDVIAGYRASTTPDAPCLPRHVGEERELRSPSLMIVFTVISYDHGSGGG